MPTRTFEDSTGAVWEVFEVQRVSRKAQAVSAGLEQGWLTFVCGPVKRRLAPFPKEWHAADAGELERLCALARVARPGGLTLERSAHSGNETATARTRVPRIRPARSPRTESGAPAELPIAATATSDDSVEQTVREFAHQARARRLPAIEAMVQLKTLLARVYTDVASVARDLRAVRRWFVEAYYFDRTPDAEPDAPDQSR